VDVVPYMPDINLADEQGQTCLHMAAKNGHIKVRMQLVRENLTV